MNRLNGLGCFTLICAGLILVASLIGWMAAGDLRCMVAAKACPSYSRP